MMNPALIPVFLRELLVERSLPREPEPDLVMDDPEQVAAYAEAGRIDGVMAASYLFHSARISQTIQGARSVLDLGCGPATQLSQIAQLNPDIQFTGIDLSPTMLSDAEAHVRNLGLKNVRFIEGDITTLEKVGDASMDGVISTMALHHLPKLELLANTFKSVRRVLTPGGAVYLTDFGRLKSLKSVIFFAYMNARYQPHLFSLDYERSLRAAFVKEEFETLASQFLPAGIKVHSTFKVPFLVIVKSPDRGLTDALRTQIGKLYRELRPRYRRDLDDMRRFFGMGGLPNDPF
ncbi:class I SAM-dependent methyltransferase [Zoogloea sp.]|uniref:class I SAM-dependent methyltransferase n=1 Tax=Zoogloea sp. TaxID=49181 RepID=UPI001415626D|nr:MAG: class I SAM-dependent methyltransferase [Zoogloea sp.]